MYNKVVTDYLDEAVISYPDKVGFIDSEGKTTFNEFRNYAYSIASVIIQRNLFKKPVAVYLDKSTKCLSAFMGVAYSGNFYTPLDIDMPIERIRKICDILEPEYIITDLNHQNAIAKIGVPILLLDDIQNSFDIDAINNTRRKIIDTDLVYALFTSGSTGIPKGVVISHRNVITYMEWSAEAFGFNSNTIFGNQTPFYFSMSVLDIYQTLKSAATLVIIPKRYFSFPAELLEYVYNNDINTIYWVPSALCQVANLKALDNPKYLTKLHSVLFAGEVMPTKQLNMWRMALPNAMFANLFGPTEVTDICSYYILSRELKDSESVPIGRACDNMDLLILNERNEETRKGEIGEMCVRGASLAAGYYNSPEKTKEAFVQNPLNMSYPEIIYRTGDLVYVNELEEIIYVSRKDFQIKHMGYRIELGEIETAVSSLDGIQRACCLYDKDNSRIVLFYTGDLESREIKRQIKMLIPKYMIPNVFCKVDEMPLNLNGKIDRQKLKGMISDI